MHCTEQRQRLMTRDHLNINWMPLSDHYGFPHISISEKLTFPARARSWCWSQTYRAGPPHWDAAGSEAHSAPSSPAHDAWASCSQASLQPSAVNLAARTTWLRRTCPCRDRRYKTVALMNMQLGELLCKYVNWRFAMDVINCSHFGCSDQRAGITVNFIIKFISAS